MFHHLFPGSSKQSIKTIMIVINNKDDYGRGQRIVINFLLVFPARSSLYGSFGF